MPLYLAEVSLYNLEVLFEVGSQIQLLLFRGKGQEECSTHEAPAFVSRGFPFVPARLAYKGFTVFMPCLRAGTGRENYYGHTALHDRNPQRPNEALFEHVDWVIEQAEALGLWVALLYVPHEMRVCVNMDVIARGPVTARWFNPRFEAHITTAGVHSVDHAYTYTRLYNEYFEQQHLAQLYRLCYHDGYSAWRKGAKDGD